MHLLWINEKAHFVGGCEVYIHQTAKLLANYGLQSSILYNPNHPVTAEFLTPFSQSYPYAHLRRQIEAIQPDLIYVHQLSDTLILKELSHVQVPVLRFFHDHKLFCLREHKYTTLRKKTCQKKTGLVCYPCLGFIQRTHQWPGLKLASLSRLLNQQKINQSFNGFIVASHYMKEQLIKHQFNPNKIHVIPLYSMPNPSVQPTTQAEQYLLFVGTISRGKGIDTLFKAMKLLKANIKLKLIGSGPQENEFRDLAAQLNLETQVDFLGTVSNTELFPNYQNCLCVILPSRQPETFGLVGLEAMQYSKPVIASDIGGISEWLIHQETGLLVPPNHPIALAQAIETLVGNPELRKQMGQIAFKHYQSLFLPQYHQEKLMALFKRVLQDTTNT